jgi:hypothetical protein
LRKYVLAIALVLTLAVAPSFVPANGASGPQVFVSSQYIIGRYGYAVINETVTFKNNLSSTVPIPDIQLGFTSNITSLIGQYNVTGSGYTVTVLPSGNQSVYVISGGGRTLAPGSSSTFSFKALLPYIVEQSGQSLKIAVMTRPFVNLKVNVMNMVVRMPSSTQLASSPPGFKESYTGLNVTYYSSLSNSGPVSATSETAAVQSSSQMDFHPLKVYSASRVVSISSGGIPVVEDSLTFKNEGITPLSDLVVNALTSPNAPVTVVPSAEPPLLNPVTLSMNNYGIDLSNSALQSPVQPDANFSVSYTYALSSKYYTVSGVDVSVDIPLSPPIQATVGRYTVAMRVPEGVKPIVSAPKSLSNVNIFSTGSVRFEYALSIGWALDRSIPVASLLFVVAFVSMLVTRQREPEEEEEREQTAPEMVSLMIKAFEEKTGLINGFFDEIAAADPNTLNKAFFDDMRERLDAFRGKALQRLNEARQRSATKKFVDLLNQINNTEREVDRAARDMLNLYEQYYTRRMRKDVFDRLLPSYRKRLDRSLNQLSDELNVAQREAKLL